MELMIGLEPITCWLQVSCSANWATPAYQYFVFYKWWWKKDSNLRSRPTTDLQSAPFGHSGIPPLVELMIGLEPITCWLQVSCSANWATPAHLLCFNGGRNRDRTCDPLLVRQVLSQLSYATLLVVEEGFEPSKSSDNRFTVCPLWPLGNSTTYGADDRTWTDNLLITSQLLCQLSHTSTFIIFLCPLGSPPIDKT